MTGRSRKSFSYAPLRATSGVFMKPDLEAAVFGWHEGLTEKSLLVFDLTAMALFSVLGVGMIWASRVWVSGVWYDQFGMDYSIVLSVARLGAVGVVTTMTILGLMAGNWLRVIDLPFEEKGMTALKLFVTGLLSWGAFFNYHDAILGAFPLTGLTLIGLMVLFRLELDEALGLTGLLVLAGLPVMVSGFLV